MLRDAAKEIGTFETGDRVRHDEHGDGAVTGTYGSRLAVDFDNVGTKRVAVGSLRVAPRIPPETLQAILVERDARRNAARARYRVTAAIDAYAEAATPQRRNHSVSVSPHCSQDRARSPA